MRPGVPAGAKPATGVRRSGEGYLYSAFRLFTSAAAPAAVVVAAATGVNLVFSTPRGGTGQGFGALQLTDLETNNDNAGRMPDELGYKIYELGVSPAQDVNPTLANLIARNMVLRLVMPEWAYTWGPFGFWPTGLGVSGLSNVGGVDLGSSGLATPHTMRKLKNPITLEPGKTFAFDLSVPRAFTVPAALQAPSQAVDIYVMMYGKWISKV